MQQIGHITLKTGRVLGFPNVFHSKLEPFGVADRMKPGHQRALKIHTIDPNRRKMGIGMVLYQRQD